MDSLLAIACSALRREKGEWRKGDGAGEGTSPMIKRTEEKFKWTESTLKDELT